MLILLVNDDGIHAPGLAAMEHALQRLGEVHVVAPATEQSGVAHSITFRTPLSLRQVRERGWAVDGTPADCVKLGVTQVCRRKPDLVVSGINGGLNAGINVLYSGTVAAAVEASLYRINSFAVSLEYMEKGTMPFAEAADIAVGIIEKVLEQKEKAGHVEPELYNVNIPIKAIGVTPTIKTVPMDPNQYWGSFEQRTAPNGFPYFWLVGRPIPKEAFEETSELTDLIALAKGFVTLTPLDFDRTKRDTLQAIQGYF